MEAFPQDLYFLCVLYGEYGVAEKEAGCDEEKVVISDLRTAVDEEIRIQLSLLRGTWLLPEINQPFSNTTLWAKRFVWGTLATADSRRTLYLQDLKTFLGYDESVLKCHRVRDDLLALCSGWTRLSTFCLIIVIDTAIRLADDCTLELLSQAVVTDPELRTIVENLKQKGSEEDAAILLVSSTVEDEEKAVCVIEVYVKEARVSSHFSSSGGAGSGFGVASTTLDKVGKDLPPEKALQEIELAYYDAASVDDGTGGHLLVYHANMGELWKFHQNLLYSDGDWRNWTGYEKF